MEYNTLLKLCDALKDAKPEQGMASTSSYLARMEQWFATLRLVAFSLADVKIGNDNLPFDEEEFYYLCAAMPRSI